ncbi:unnamed protein product [Cyclocybe aegerita]|uniref:Nucleolar GTP-binding protein 2 n=1 Tax=Cyclocybe aegerita TaxID=1973307 RepID=A0A8S0X3C4_CYCAE|nr:unnamed protein product [Cyclocybe aegerita]
MSLGREPVASFPLTSKMTTAKIAECLTATLNPDTNTRIAAELKLGEWFTRPGASFSRIAIALRKYVRERWSPYFSTFKGCAPPVEIKAQIREAVFHGLSDPLRKIRTLSAHTLSSIANCDWPDEYPDLLASLISLISSGSPNSVHGAMQVFTEFIKSDLTEDQILPVLRELLPVLLQILGSTESHSAPTRARVVSVFRQCVTALFMVKDQHPQAVKEATASVLPVWLEAFKVLLSIDPLQDVANASSWDGLTVRIQIFKTLDTLHTSFPRALVDYLNDFLAVSINHLRALYSTFTSYYLNGSESAPNTSEDEPIELPQLVCPIIDLLAAVIRSGKAHNWLSDANIFSLVSSVFAYIQMSEEDAETWASNANAFVAQEEDETQAYSVRVAGFDLLSCLMERAPAQTTASFQSSITQVVVASEQTRNAGDPEWWRPLEAGLAAIGSQAESVLDCIEDEQESGRQKPIDIDSLLSNVIPPILGVSEAPFLQGRGFVFASQYAKLLPLQSAGHYLNAAVQILESSEASVPVKISAVKAIHNFCQDGEDSALIPFAPRITQDLGPLLLVASEDTLSLILESLSVVLEVDQGKWLTQELAGSLVTAILEVWNKNNKDPIFISIFTDILTNLASSPANGIYETVIKQALPPLSAAVTSAKKEESWIASSAIDLISSLVSGAKENNLGEGFFQLLAPGLFSCLGGAEDRDVLQNGISCLTLIIRKDCNQIVSWNDGSGRSGLEYVLSLTGRMLESQDESGGLQIGDLIIHLLRRTGDAVLPVLPQLLQAMVSRMTTAKTATFLQSLVIPFAFLINNQRDTVLALLESLDINGRNGLDILIQTWCENAETFQGFWPSRISTLALTQLLVSDRPSLQNLTVKGDIIIKPETKNVIMTRSKTKKTPHEFTAISFPVKALKIILRDVQSGGDAATLTAQGEVYDVESDDGDEDWAEEEKQNQGFKADEFAFLSDMLGPKGMAFDNDEILDDNDDEDLKNDPVSHMDLQAHLQAFLRDCAAHNTNNFAQLVDQLSPEETLVVRRIVNVSLKKVKGENFYRNAKQVARVKMLNGGKAVRDKDGKIIQAAAFQKGEDETKPGRVQPDRRWFGNTRVISQTALDHFRTSLGSKKDDPYSVLLRRNKLPMALLDDAANPNLRKRAHIVETEPFAETFGPKAQRKKPRIEAGTFEELSQLGAAAGDEADNAAASSGQAVIEPLASSIVEPQTHADYNEPIYAKGTSRRIYGELYKVIDSSDVILHILDARDPFGTMCESVLEYIRKEKSHKQVVLVINKCDLVPNWVTARYIKHLTPRYPTIAFHASPNHSFGKGSLIQLLRQFSQLHSDKKQISVGFMGYPNVGKSSVINTLKSNKVCRVAPVPGETKVWQYITLTKRIYLIDCPGIVPASAHDSQAATVLKGVVRVEALATPSEHIPVLMERVKPIYLSRTYGIDLPEKDDPTKSWEPEEFLDKLARMKGRLLKHGEPDLDSVAKIILSDWVRGRIPFFVPPPERSEDLNAAEAKQRKKNDLKGKGKATSEAEVPGVKQNLKTLIQKNTFLPEDIQKMDEEPKEDEDEDVDDDASGSGTENSDHVDEGEDEDDLKWTDVFEGINSNSVVSNAAKEPKSDALPEKEESSDEEASDKKEPRMKTNKRKAGNFYSTANVKNKSRSKAALMKSLPVGKKGKKKSA